MYKLYSIAPVQTGIDFFMEFFKIACKGKQVAAGDVMSRRVIAPVKSEITQFINYM